MDHKAQLKTEIRAYFVTHDNSNEVITNKYVDLANNAVFESLALSLVTAERLEDDLSGDVIDWWSGNLEGIDLRSKFIQVAGRWAGRVRLGMYSMEMIDEKFIQTDK